MSKRAWQIQQVKDRLSEVVDLALAEGPQTITRHGKKVAVIVSVEDFEKRRRAGARGTVLPFLRKLRLGQLDVERSRDVDREIDL
jgi:prevent-host-death family protein